MPEFSFYPLSIDSITDPEAGNSGVIRLFGRTTDNKRVCVLDPSFSAYFWAIIDKKSSVKSLTEEILALKLDETKRIVHATNVTYEEKQFLGETVHALKIAVNNPRDINVLKDDIKEMTGVIKCTETDIPLAQRYTVDTGIEPLQLCTVKGTAIKKDYITDMTIEATHLTAKEDSLLTQPRMLAFDIEVYNKIRSPNSDEDPIVMVAMYGTGNYKKVITWKDYPGRKKHVTVVKNEEALIAMFLDDVRSFGPDYLVGYYSDGFDFPYLKDRAHQMGIDLDLGLDESNVRFSRRANTSTAKITGMPHMDIFKFIRRIVSGQLNLPSYTLDAVAKHLLGEGKTGADVGQLYAAWDEGGERLGEYAEYNLIDAKRTFQLMEIMIPQLNEFVKITGLPPEEVSRMSYGRLVESYLLKNLQQFNEIAPNRPYQNVIGARDGDRVEGAFVFQPEPGVYEDVAVFDFKSLYPTIISVHNICPSTLTAGKKDAHTTPELTFHGKKRTFNYNYKKDGIFPKLIRDILIRRNRIKEMLKKNKKDPVLHARQYSLKILANSAYGYFGFSGARWYCKECAASTTAYGRDYIAKLIEKAEKEKFKVIYGDTDSIFLSLGGKKTLANAKTFLDDVNKELPSLMELELDGFYPRGIFVMKKGDKTGAKKKYALIDEEHDVKIVGFETVRGDWSGIAKDTQKEVLRIILEDNDIKKAVRYVRDVLMKTESGKLPIEQVHISKKLTRGVDEYTAEGPHVKVARQLIKRGETPGIGSTITYVVQEGKGSIGGRSVPADEAEAYDAEYYIKNQIIPAVERIFEAVGYKKEDLLAEHKQKSLGDF